MVGYNVTVKRNMLTICASKVKERVRPRNVLQSLEKLKCESIDSIDKEVTQCEALPSRLFSSGGYENYGGATRSHVPGGPIPLAAQ